MIFDMHILHITAIAAAPAGSSVTLPRFADDPRNKKRGSEEPRS
jgi:hypothetical protein